MSANKILDMTAGCGGNILSFCNYFNHVIGIECNINRFNILENNLKCYDFNNYTIHCDDSLKYIDDSIDVFFIDPPWGGPDYKNMNTMEIGLSGFNIANIMYLMPCNKLIVLKLPFNYNLIILSKYNIVLNIPIRNIIIIFILL